MSNNSYTKEQYDWLAFDVPFFIVAMTPRILMPVLWLAISISAHVAQPRLSLVATWASGEPEGTEILSYHLESRIRWR